MTLFTEMLATALLAVTAENLLFTGGVGFSRVLRAARRPRTLHYYALFVAAFSLLAALCTAWLSPVLAAGDELLFLRPAIYAVAAALFYLCAAWLLKKLLPRLYRRVSKILAPAAMNCVVLSMPYVQRALNLELPLLLAYAAGTGAAFYLASLIMTQAFALCQHSDMPRAFKGLPAILIYVGILSLAFLGFTGTRLFR